MTRWKTYDQREELRPERPPTGFDSHLSSGTNAVSLLEELSPRGFRIYYNQRHLPLPTFARYLMAFLYSSPTNIASTFAQSADTPEVHLK